MGLVGEAGARVADEGAVGRGRRRDTRPLVAVVESVVLPEIDLSHVSPVERGGDPGGAPVEVEVLEPGLLP